MKEKITVLDQETGLVEEMSKIAFDMLAFYDYRGRYIEMNQDRLVLSNASNRSCISSEI